MESLTSLGNVIGDLQDGDMYDLGKRFTITDFPHL